MFNRNNRVGVYCAALISAAALTACAGNDERPTGDFARAETVIEQAEQSGAREASPLAFGEAEQKLAAARAAEQEDEHEQARRLAEQAAVDAELAVAEAERDEAERAAREISASIDTLRRETRRQ